MLVNKKTVELLAPVGQWSTLVAAVEAGADAVYMGGKAFNMRRFRDDFNFDNKELKKAVEYAHAHGVSLYITLNNLISDEEIPALEEYLTCLSNDVHPDALIVQDFAVVEIVKRLGLNLTLHSSIMMNTHNAQMIEKFQQFGITRIVASREMSLADIRLMKNETNMEIEFFVHGDMCIAEGGQCIHSGVVFGHSSNRGLCMKPCRWQYKFAEEKNINDAAYMAQKKSEYKMALKDMCMYQALPELIQSGVYSFKIEGRMRDAEFVSNIVGTYRRAIDRYVADPTGYSMDKKEWQILQDNEVRGYSTCFAVDKPTYDEIGLSGEGEPRFFSKAVKEADLTIKTEFKAVSSENKPVLAVRCASLEHLKEACANGADVVYAGGDIYRPLTPWTLADFKEARIITEKANCKLVIATPRITRRLEISELEQLFTQLNIIKPDGILVHNIGTLNMAKKLTAIPVQCGVSFSLFNAKAAVLLQNEGAVMGTASLELGCKQVQTLIEKSSLPIEVIVHGAIEAMICDFDFIEQETGKKQITNPEIFDKHYAFIDTADEIHSVRRTQYNRNNVLFAHDLCLLPYLDKLNTAASFCIEAQDYTAGYTGSLVNIYRQAIDDFAAYNIDELIEEIKVDAPRSFGNGVYRYEASK